jgi:peptidoglycan/LPS O-acetylase OafA/YrhL
VGADAGGSGGGMSELKALTAARGLAAWWVVFFHLRLAMPWLPEPVLAVLSKGYLAVDFFFLLSGFVIWLSWAPRLREGGWGAVPRFLQKRVARVWPLHLMMLGFGVLLAGVLVASGRPAPDFPAGELPLHLLLVQNWGFTSALTWNDPAWSISCEWAAYLLFPAVAFAIDWRRVPAWRCVATVVALCVLLASVFAGAGEVSLGADIPRFGLVRCLAEFAAGGAIAGLWWRRRERPIVPALLALAGTGVALLLPFEPLRAPLAFAGLLLTLALMSPRVPTGWLHALGEASYATYLSHYLLWFAFKLALVRDAANVPPHLIALFVALVLAASFALYRWVERPAQAWINAVPLDRFSVRRRPSPAR